VDIFSINELLLVAFVALLVIGPERLPETLRTLGLWLGRLTRSFNSVKSEIEKEIGMDEIRRQLHNESVMAEMKRIEEEVKNSVPDHLENDIAPPPQADETLPPKAAEDHPQEDSPGIVQADDGGTLGTGTMDNGALDKAESATSAPEPESEPEPEPTVVPRSEAELEALHEARRKAAQHKSPKSDSA